MREASRPRTAWGKGLVALLMACGVAALLWPEPMPEPAPGATTQALQNQVPVPSAAHDLPALDRSSATSPEWSAPARATGPRHRFALHAHEWSAAGFRTRSTFLDFGLADSTSQLRWLPQQDVGAACEWTMRSPTCEILVDQGHLRRLRLVASAPPTTVELDQWLHVAWFGDIPPPPGSDERDVRFAPELHPDAVFEECTEAVDAARWSSSLRFRFHRDAVIRGRVLLANGEPADDFLVGCVLGNGASGGSTFIGLPRTTAQGDAADGRYELSHVPHGTVTVRAVSRRGDGTATADVLVDRPQLSIDLVLREGPRVRGHVRTIAGEPIAGARVLWCGADGSWRNRTLTAADGTFALHDLPPSRGAVWVCLRDPERSDDNDARLPIGGLRDVFPDGAPLEVVCDPASCRSALVVQTAVPDGADDAGLAVRLWQRDSGLGVHVGADDRRVEQLPAGHYDVELVYPGLGVVRGGPYWLDGHDTVTVTDIAFPEPAHVAFDGPVPARWELVHHRADVDLRIATDTPFAGPHLLRAGDYSLLWRTPDGSVRQRPFRVDYGERLRLR